MSGLYQSGWNPPGVRKDWERSSIGNQNAGEILSRKLIPESWGTPTDAVVWCDDDGQMRVLVADYANGRRAIFRQLARTSKTTMTRTPRP